MPLKQGTNQSDRKAIKDYLASGETDAGVIARRLSCAQGPVQNFIDSLTKPKRKPRAKPAEPAEPEAPQSDPETTEQT